MVHRKSGLLSAPCTLLLILFVTTGCGLFSPDEEGTAYVAGEVYFGRNDYIEYRAGDLPVILSAPHGGLLEPSEIPDRTWGTTAHDRRTEELARAISSAISARMGGYPHIIICHLHRRKLDANRAIQEAAQGNQWAEKAWYEYHDFILAAKAAVAEEHGSGFYIDLHGHGHKIQRLELGYMLSASDLTLPDTALNSPTYRNKSSIRTLVMETGLSLPALVRGPTSLGSLLEDLGFPSVPSAGQPNPGGAPYYSGGYSTGRHGSSDGGSISGVQIECNWEGVRSTETERAAFSQAMAEALETFLETHYSFEPLALEHR